MRKKLKRRGRVKLTLPLKHWLRVQTLLVVAVGRLTDAARGPRPALPEVAKVAKKAAAELIRFNRALYLARGGSAREWRRIQRAIEREKKTLGGSR